MQDGNGGAGEDCGVIKILDSLTVNATGGCGGNGGQSSASSGGRWRWISWSWNSVVGGAGGGRW